MPTLQTQHLTGAALDWAVAMADDRRPIVRSSLCFDEIDNEFFCPSVDWGRTGLIIEREHIEIAPTYADDGKTVAGWMAIIFNDDRCETQAIVQDGATPCEAAMRAYVHSKLGPTVDIPEELAQ